MMEDGWLLLGLCALLGVGWLWQYVRERGDRRERESRERLLNYDWAGEKPRVLKDIKNASPEQW